MDIYDYLKMDHQKVDHLFKLFEEAKSSIRKKEIVTLLEKELLVHAHSEQETFYAYLKQYDTSQEDAIHGEKEHKEIEKQIELINKASPEEWQHQVHTLKEMVQHHVREEEGEIFRRAKKVISKEKALILKERMHYLKGTFLLWLDKKEKESH